MLRPKSVAVIGGGSWCENVIRECRSIGFDGSIWPVHPNRSSIGGLTAYPSVEALPAPPDTAFIGVNRRATLLVVSALSAIDAGGAVCFASGFSEASAELEDANALQTQLLAAAGEMRILGPNCYGYVNALDGVALWPDVHGMTRQDSGVAILCQSSNIALNLSMQQRGLPLAYLMTVGNQAQTNMAEIADALLSDHRVTALGLHVEGFGDLRAFEALAARAERLGKPIVVLKVGTSEQAQTATISHTASLAGTGTGATAFLHRLGFGQVGTPSEFIETLKLLHVTGKLASNRIASMSCSGGEASLMADAVLDTSLVFPTLNRKQKDGLRTALGPKVALANPLDYHTYIWGDQAALTACFSAMAQGDIALAVIVLDLPRTDRFTLPDWHLVLEAAAEAGQTCRRPMALISSMAEGMPESFSQKAFDLGVVPLAGITEALVAIDVAANTRGVAHNLPLFLPSTVTKPRLVPEDAAKTMLAEFGLSVPISRSVTGAAAAQNAASDVGFPVVLKGLGLAHKTEAGAVAVNLTTPDAVLSAAQSMPSKDFLVEEMIGPTTAELLIGVVCDPAHGFMTTLGAGGVLTELMADSVSFLLPVSASEIEDALRKLRIFPLLDGYRGSSGTNLRSVIDAVLAVQAFVKAHRETLYEVEINPLLCTPDRAVAADALIRIGDAE